MDRLYRLLLRAYPRAVRDRFGADMADLLADLRREAHRRRGRPAAASVVVRTLAELPLSAWRARSAARRTKSAHHAARKRVSPPLSTSPPSPPVRRGNVVEVLMNSFRHGLRTLIQSPGFTAVVVVTLALGIGANTVVFSVVHGVVLSPLPYEEPEELVRVYQMWPRTPPELGFLSGAALREYRELDDLFAGVAIFYTYSPRGADILIDGEPERILVMPTGAGSFAALGAAPLMGREFRRDEERWDAGVIVISHGLWQRYFGGDAEVIGTTMDVGGETRTVIGVMPASFRNPIGYQPDAWVPEQLIPLSGDGWDPNGWDNHYLSAVARLRDGVGVEQAHARLDSLVPSYEERYPDVDGKSARLVPLLRDTVGDTASMLWILMAAVGLVLLIACVNVAGLCLARGADRSRELAIRAALGAGRRRLIGQLLAESLWLGAAGGILGLVLASGGLRVVLAFRPADMPRAVDVGLDFRVFAFALITAVLTGALFGLAPALRFSRPDIERVLRQEDRGNSGSSSLQTVRSGLVVAEIALALVLLFGAGLLSKSFANLLAVDLGVDTAEILTYRVNLPDARYAEPEQRVAFYDELFRGVEALPGVTAVGAVSFLPADGEYHQWGMRRLDIDPESDAARSGPNVRVVDGDYFELMGIRLLRGRTFAVSDTLAAPPVILINEVVAEQLYPDRDPIGAPVRLAGREFEVVGIVSSSARDPLGTRGPDVYLSHDQYADNRNWAMAQTVRVAGDPTAFVPAVRAVLRDVDSRLVLLDPRSMDTVVAAGVSTQRFTTGMMTAFALVALLLAAVGVYGVLSYAVTRRTHEFGIRMALGADDRRVRRMILRQAAGLTAGGLLVGGGGALALSGLMASMLFDVGATDGSVLATVAAVLALVAALAAYVPARRATSVDPLQALRD